LAMGVAGPTTYDDWGNPIPGVIPDTLAQRQLDADIRARQSQLGEQTTARQREEALTRVAMGLDPTGTMDPSQTLASRQFELDRAFQQQQLALQQAQLGIPTETTYVDGMAIPGRPPDTLAQRQLTQQATEATLAEEFRRAQLAEQVRQANIQAGIIETALPFREFQEQQRRALEAEAMRRIDQGIPLGAELREVLGLERELDFDTDLTRAEREAGRVRTEAAGEALLARTSREEQASMQRDLERTIAEGARGLTEREQNIQRDLAKIGLGLGAEGAQAIPFRQLEEQMRATRRGEELQQSALQGLIGDRETVAGRAQSEAERAALVREDFERAQLLGVLDGADTLEAQLARAGITGTLDGTATLAGRQLTQQVEESKKERDLRRDLANLQADAAAEDRDLTVSESEKERELRKELVDLQIEESIAERGLTAAEANKERELRRELAALQATEAGAGRGLERELGIAQISGMLGEQPTLEAELARRQLTEAERAALARERFQRAELFGGFQSPTLEAELGRGQLAQAGETARLNALVNIFQAAMQNPYAFSAMQAMGGGGAPFANLLAPLGFQMPGQVGQGAQQFFLGGLPTMGALGQADPEGLNYLQALLGFSGVSPQQFGRLSAGITPGATMRPAATTGMFRGRRGR